MGNPLHLNKLESPSPKDYLCQFWLKLALLFWRKRLLNDTTPFLHFVIISPLKRTWPFIWTNLNSLHPKAIISLGFVFTIYVEERFRTQNGRYFNSTIKNVYPFWVLNLSFIHSKYEPEWYNCLCLHPRIICTKFDWIWPAGSTEYDFKKFSVYFYSSAIISPWRREIPFIWTNLKPLHPRMICAKSG
jgi:hypothetical protein